jgi:hypothetical protein
MQKTYGILSMVIFLTVAGCSGEHHLPHGDTSELPDQGSDLDSFHAEPDSEGGDGEERLEAVMDLQLDPPGEEGDVQEGNGCIPADCVPVEGDRDCDTIPDDADNCPECSNECQEDRDGDGLGDVCDDSCDERCIGESCGAEGIAGCNCTSCPEGTFCTGDAREPVGVCDGSGVYSFCAPTCTDSGDCPAPLVCQSIAGRCLCTRPFPSAPVCSSEAEPDV